MLAEHRVVICTERLDLAPFAHAHAPEVAPLLNDTRVSGTTSNIPHPYTEADARTFADIIEASAGATHAWLLRRRSDGRLVGGNGLHAFRGDSAELGYWVGLEFWGRGYATEALIGLLGHAFGSLGLEKIHACYYLRNPASRRVMEKAGFVQSEADDRAACVTKNGVSEAVGWMELGRASWHRGVGEPT
ncbi:MAG: GNAT family N-acetyltransferase [Phycisphaerales bacterium]